ncbi:MAG TPA: LacI family DNA-binding transcriptional regulator [Acidobacteriaceae bacterium]|nr:LacI family DNA-binding transcriptional regulator [Acidobacteriaceae bacterium]
MPPQSHAALRQPRVTLKTIANHLGLAIGTVSAALNNSPAAQSIPEHTKQRILDAAKELNYQTNYFARSLRLQRTFTIGVIAEQIGDPYGSAIISGIEETLRDTQYLFLTAVHRHDRDLLRRYAQSLASRGAEGFITVDLPFAEDLSLPTIAVAGHASLPGVTSLVLDQARAAHLALQHLVELGHHEIAFLRGPKTSSDSASRWQAIRQACKLLEIPMHPHLTIEIEGDATTPQMGYPYAKALLARSKSFTALFAFNDLAALGAIFALQEAGLRVPQDVSVIGFDDLPMALFSTPSLTTIRQPLERMGKIAAETLLHRIEKHAPHPSRIMIEPELIVRASTGPAALISSRRKPR